MDIKGFRDVTMMDWNGVVASIVFAGGCNFRCLYCHNYALAFTPNALNSICEMDILDKIKGMRDWIDGVIVSGGEPTLCGEGLAAFLKNLRDMGFKTKLYTNGSMPDILERLLSGGLLNAVSMDIKHRPDRYEEVVNVDMPGLHGRIRRSVESLKKSDIETEFRLTLVKGLHSLEDIKFVKELVMPKTLILQNVNESDIPAAHKDMIIPFPAAEFEELEKLNQ